jgi:hypothetical protein
MNNEHELLSWLDWDWLADLIHLLNCECEFVTFTYLDVKCEVGKFAKYTHIILLVNSH